jgi:predicted permease
MGSAAGFLISFAIETKAHVMYLIYAQTGISVIMLICIWAYFPDQPPSPPAISTEERNAFAKQSFLEDLKELVTNPSFVALVVGNIFQHFA